MATSSNADQPSVPAVRTLLASAYADDPLMRWLFSGVAEPVHASAAWLGLFVERYLAAGDVDAIVSDGGLDAVALWRRPPGGPAAPSGLPSAGGLYAALVGAERAASVGRALHVIGDVTPSEPHLYLHFLAVDPGLQRGGLGARLVAAGMADADERGLGIHLETTNPDVVPFYRSLGFTVRAEVQIPHGGPQLWAMWRSPAQVQPETVLARGRR